MYKHFFFDLDGTLINSYPKTIAAIQKIIKKQKNIDVTYEELFLDCMVCVPYLFEKHGLDIETYKNLDNILKEDNSLPPNELMPRIVEVLEELKRRNYGVYTYTNRNESTIEILEGFGINKYFDGHIVSAHKPHPTTLNDFVEKLNLNKEECLVVGDRILDLEGAKGAGVDSYSINDYKIEPLAVFQSQTYDDFFKFINLKKIAGVLILLKKDYSKNKINRLIQELVNRGIDVDLLKDDDLNEFNASYIVLSDTKEIIDKANELGFISVGINDAYSYNKANMRIEEPRDLVEKINKLQTIIK